MEKGSSVDLVDPSHPGMGGPVPSAKDTVTVFPSASPPGPENGPVSGRTNLSLLPSEVNVPSMLRVYVPAMPEDPEYEPVEHRPDRADKRPVLVLEVDGNRIIGGHHAVGYFYHHVLEGIWFNDLGHAVFGGK